MFYVHHIEQKLLIAYHSLINAPLDKEIIIQVLAEESSIYYDIQVLETNNYVDEYGFIHHNSGKTYVGSSAMCQHFYEFPRINQGYFAPSFPQIRDIFYPTIEEVAAATGLRVKINQGNKEVHFYEGTKFRGTTICRSMDDPANIVGFKIGNALIDELDVMKKEKAQLAWRKIIARMRYKVAGIRNGIDVTTTPEGFKFVYEQFFKVPNEKPELKALYGLIQSSTHENARFLPDDYIPSLIATYPENLIEAYLEGQFVNLVSGSVYPDFSRTENHTDEVIEVSEPLHIGMDFNVFNCTATVGVIRNNQPRILSELTGVRDTPAMIQAIKERFFGHHVTVYPDASGDSNKSVNASLSDIQLLKDAGFAICVNGTNPLVKDRVMSINTAILCNSERKLLVNTRN
ncbi:MAG: terminase family protein, partial [Pseudomonadota bacterium]|nr:terminase family protein [Pseudomonadota bacterium]